MTNEQFLFTLFATIFYCLGWRTITDEGQLFYWVREPFEGLYDEIELKKDTFEMLPQKRFARTYIRWLQIKLFCVTPFVLCITCFASFWGVVVFVALNGLHLESIPYLILNSVSASFIQTFIWSLYVRHIQ